MREREHVELLAEVARAFEGRRVVAIGAAALRWHYPAFRGTLDLDLCIAIDLAEHAEGAGLPAAWRRRPDTPHRWELPDGQLLDIVPAGDELLRAGSVTWPGGATMDLTGIDLAMCDHLSFCEELPTTVRVASRRALFVTEVVAWQDRPYDRQKDLGDIARLLDEYVGDDDPRCFDEPALSEREWDERPAFLLGMDLGAICTERHIGRIREFARLIGDPAQREHSWMIHAGPSAWRADATMLPRRLGALLDGIGNG